MPVGPNRHAEVALQSPAELAAHCFRRPSTRAGLAWSEGADNPLHFEVFSFAACHSLVCRQRPGVVQ